MPSDISADTRIHLAQSLPLVEREKDTIVTRIRANLGRADGDAAHVSQAAAAKDVVECLISEARGVLDTGRLSATGFSGAARRSLEEAGQDLPRVGDALVPILKDVLGSAIPRQAVAAWSTLFWAVFTKERARTPALAS